MRKMTANSKITKVIAIAVATMIAVTAVPTTVYAEDIETPAEITAEADAPVAENNTESDNNETTSSENETAPQEETVSIAEAMEVYEVIVPETPAAPSEPEAEYVPVEESVDATEEAADQVNALAEKDNSEQVQEAAAALNGGENENSEVIAPVADVVSDITTELTKKNETTNTNVKENLAAAQNAENAGNEIAEPAAEAMSDANDAVEAAIEKANQAITNNDTKAMEEAQTELDQAVTKASAAKETAQKAYDDAKVEYDNAEKELARNFEALASAKGDSEAALERLAAAKEALETAQGNLGDKAAKLAENEEKLQNLQTQYYSMIVYYYRASKTTVNNVEYKNVPVYNADGTLNIAGSAEKNKANVNALAEHPDTNITMLGRYVTGQLVKYMISQEEGIDPESINYGVSDVAAKNKYDMQAGVLFRNTDNKDQAMQGDVKQVKKTVDGTNVSPAAIEKIEWHQIQDGKNGRNNYVIVKYTDKNGASQERWFNYVYKNGKYNDELDLTNGMFYLAEINKETGKAERIINNDDNYDNYTKLVQDLELAVKYNDYNDALQAVKEAEDKVQKLDNAIAALQNTKVNTTALQTLKDELDRAEKDLKAAEDKKNALEKELNPATVETKTEEKKETAKTTATPATATAAVADTTNNITNDAPVSNDAVAETTDDNTTATVAEATETRQGQVLGENRNRTVAVANKKGAVLGANREKLVASEVTEEGVEAEAEGIEDTEKKIVMIEDEAVALAKAPVEATTFQFNWLWLLLLLLLIVITKVTYDKCKEHNEKVYNANIAKIEKNN